MEEEGRQLSILVQNPLLFDHIVERVIFFVDVEFLPSVRLVSRQWEKFALPKLLQNLNKIPVVLKGQGNISGDDSKMERYLSYRANEPRLIFSNFSLENASSSEMDKFMSTCAVEITELKLKFNECQNPETLLKMLVPLVNLKTLSLEVDSTCSFPTDPPPTPLTSKILNLKRLCLNGSGANASPQLVYATFIAVLRACKSLDELSLVMPYSRSHYLPFVILNCPDPNAIMEITAGEMHSGGLEYLINLNLNLKVLSCKILELSEGEGVFSRFLEAHKNTLESVVVGEVKTGCQGCEEGEGGVEWNGAYEITFPDVMPKLKVFKMGLPAPSLLSDRVRFSPVNFPVQLPSLDKLILYDGSTWDYERTDPNEWEYLRGFFEGSDPHPKLTELCLPFALLRLRKSTGAVFPEIKSLKMETGFDESLHEIWEMWSQLKSLDLTLNGDRKKRRKENRVENFITGLQSEGTQGSSKDVDSNLPSIANLKELKQLKLRMIGDCGGSLSDLSVSRAFCKLPCLEFLLLNRHKITKRGTRELLKYHPLLKQVVCPVHPEVFKIQREYLPNDFIPSGFSTEDSASGCCCSLPK